MGDGMADWLAYGLEDSFSELPEINIVRKNKLYSGLLHYEAKGELDWWHVARDILANEKADYVIMMLGLSDRQDIREKDLAKETEKAEGDQAKDEAEKKDGQNPAKAGGTDKFVAPATPERNKKANGVVEFRSAEWAKIYSRRVDETIAALKSKGVPVFWVSLPSIRGTRSTADAAYLNDLYRSRAERAGIVYIDVWEGFVDEAGKYSNYGPDYEGQTRRLRSSDGVFFTKYGARKLAHYVERELRRYMNNRAQVALPSGPVTPVPSSDEKPATRPLAGPVVPLTGTRESPTIFSGASAAALSMATLSPRRFWSRARQWLLRPAAPTILYGLLAAIPKSLSQRPWRLRPRPSQRLCILRRRVLRPQFRPKRSRKSGKTAALENSRRSR